MTRLSQLIEALTDIQASLDEGVDPEVRLAHQPHYPLQFAVGAVALVEDEEEEDDDDPVVYIGEGGEVRSSPYLPGAAARALDWRS